MVGERGVGRAGAGFLGSFPQGQDMDPGQKKLAPNQWLSWRWAFLKPVGSCRGGRRLPAGRVGGRRQRTDDSVGLGRVKGPEFGRTHQRDEARHRPPERIYVGGYRRRGVRWILDHLDPDHRGLWAHGHRFLAIHPDSNDVLYLGTGDPQISGHPRIGNGVYKSQDGDTWSHLGLTDQRIVSQPIDPSDLARLRRDHGQPECARARSRSVPGLDAGDVGASAFRGRFSGHQRHPDFQPNWDVAGKRLAPRPDVHPKRIGPNQPALPKTDGGDTWELLDNPWGEGRVASASRNMPAGLW